MEDSDPQIRDIPICSTIAEDMFDDSFLKEVLADLSSESDSTYEGGGTIDESWSLSTWENIVEEAADQINTSAEDDGEGSMLWTYGKSDVPLLAFIIYIKICRGWGRQGYTPLAQMDLVRYSICH